MSTISLHFNKEEELVSEYMNFYGIKRTDDFIESAIFEKIEEDLDLKLGEKAKSILQDSKTEFLFYNEMWSDLDL
ncbi:MAG: DUF6290 family protein [Lactobacillales bacterium]|jgi:adenosine deaminase|nr:DUF6290 family protein [Lactobacillales bacterium]